MEGYYLYGHVVCMNTINLFSLRIGAGMRFFFASYGNRENFNMSKAEGVFGLKATRSSDVRVKFDELKPGDIVLIRGKGRHLWFFGYCVVVDKPYYHGDREKGHPFSELLWPDEQRIRQIIYHCRVKVDFRKVPPLPRLDEIDWDELLNLRWYNKKGEEINTKHGLLGLFKGNFIPERSARGGDTVEHFQELLGMVSPEVKADLSSIEVEEERFEGKKRKRFSNYYERVPELRSQAIRIHGTRCMACKFNFNEWYGTHGRGFIEVHHTRPISQQGGSAKVNPKTDMIVLCSNCHSMVHRKKNKVLSLQELRNILRNTGHL